jgi:cytochrome c
MDSFELNKIIGAILGTLLFVMGIGFIAEALYAPIEDQGQGYALPEPEAAAGTETAEAAEPTVPLGVLLASASADNGAAAVRKCQGCHTFEQGGANKQGPNLYDIVNRLTGSHEGFTYSDAFNALREEGHTWTYEEINNFITNPREYVPGTKMNFPGVRTAEERADILAYMQTLSADPKPFPEPEVEEPPPANIPEGGDVVENDEASEPVDVLSTPVQTMTETVPGTSTGSGPGTPASETESGETQDAGQSPNGPAETAPAAPETNASEVETPEGAPANEAPATGTTPAEATTPPTTEPSVTSGNNAGGASEVDADQSNDINASGAPAGDGPVPPNAETQSGGTPTPQGTLSPWVTAPLGQ